MENDMRDAEQPDPKPRDKQQLVLSPLPGAVVVYHSMTAGRRFSNHFCSVHS
jgi:hypothetical protein